MPGAKRSSDPIARRVQALVRRCGTRDPYAIAGQCGIELLRAEHFGRLKGMYVIIKGVRFILLNADNPPEVDRIVCAHELGHDQLHREMAAMHALREVTLYDLASRLEYEANRFAAELLLEDGEVLDLITEGNAVERIAALTACDANLVALKIDRLIADGYPLRPQTHNTAFLR